MTLYNLLIDEMATHVELATNKIMNNTEFNKAYGQAVMCSKLLTILSDDTLKMEVMMRHDVLKKGE